jgi:outer membrane lipoprotein-sorting protein
MSIVVATALSIGPAAAAPSTPSADVVLANVQRYYASARRLTAQFRQRVTNPSFGTTHDSVGKLYAAEPAQFRFEYRQKKNGKTVRVKEFVFDGKALWYVDHPNMQIYRQPAQRSALPAAIGFLTGASSLASDFAVSLAASGTYGGAHDVVLQLAPKQPSAQYKQLVFVVDPSDWHVKESIVIDASGATNDFTFFSEDTSAKVPASLFAFDPKALPTYKLIH